MHRSRSRNRFGGKTQYQMLRDSAIAAARANNAALWFAGAPSDLAGFVYQDSTGTTAATGADPIGLMLDRSYGTANKGAEVVGDPGFADPGYWSVDAGVAITGGQAVWTAAAINSAVYRPSLLTVGKTYQIEFDVASISSGSLFVDTGSGTNPPPVTAPGRFSCRVLVGSTLFIVRCGTNTTAAIDNISCREVFGYPATQATAANKPTLELQANGYYGMRFDGTNDFLQHSLAAGMTQAHTLIAAYNNTSFAPSRTIATAGAPATSVQQRVSQLRVGGGTVQVFMVNDAGGNTSIQPAGSVLNTPSLASVVSDGSTYELFKADTSSGTAAVVALPATVTVGVIGAKDGAAGEPFAGLIWLVAQNLAAMPTADQTTIKRFAALLSGAAYT